MTGPMERVMDRIAAAVGAMRTRAAEEERRERHGGAGADIARDALVARLAVTAANLEAVTQAR